MSLQNQPTISPLHPTSPSSPQPCFPLLRLPVELQLEITSHLTPATRQLLRYTSRHFHSLLPPPKKNTRQLSAFMQNPKRAWVNFDHISFLELLRRDLSQSSSGGGSKYRICVYCLLLVKPDDCIKSHVGGVQNSFKAAVLCPKCRLGSWYGDRGAGGLMGGDVVNGRRMGRFGL